MTRLAAAFAAAVLVAITSCGSTPPPGELVPALRTQLAQVDDALANQDYAQVRQDLDALGEQTSQARNSNRITVEQAERIFAAIARLTADLPQPDPSTQPTPSTGAAAPAAEPGRDASQDGSNTSNDNDEDTDPDDQKGRGDPKDKNKDKDKDKQDRRNG
jgi:hypothetical protein